MPENGLEEGRGLLETRLDWLEELAVREPAAAVKAALSWSQRKVLPAAWQKDLEQAWAARGRISTTWILEPGGEVGVKWLLESPGHTGYVELSAGRRAALERVMWSPGRVAGSLESSFQAISLRGITAVGDSAARILEPGEPIPAGKLSAGACPVSGEKLLDPAITVAAPAEVIVASVGDAFEPYCEPAHVDERAHELWWADGWGEGGQPFGQDVAPEAKSVGQLRLLYIPVTYADQNVMPEPLEDMIWQLEQAAIFYQNNSYGKLTLLHTVAPLVRLPQTEAWYKNAVGDAAGRIAEMQDAIAGVRALGYDPSRFDTIAMRRDGGSESGPNGMAGNARIWINKGATRGARAETLTHEIGHTLGLGHASSWDGGAGDPFGPSDEKREYGHIFDVMGDGPWDTGHFNPRAKFKIGWMTPDTIHNVSPGQSGVYRIYAQDAGRADPLHPVALRLRKDADRTYYFDYRQAFSGRDSQYPAMRRALGVCVEWESKGSSAILVDTTPGTLSEREGRGDSGVALGRTYADTEAEIFVTPVAWTAAGNGKPAALDVSIVQEVDASNRAPVPGAVVMPAPVRNAEGLWEVTVHGSATDPDATDTELSWHWESDASIPEPSAGPVCRVEIGPQLRPFQLRYTVSDRRGGTVSGMVRSTAVAAGVNVYRVDGRVQSPSGQPVPDTLVLLTGNGEENYTFTGQAGEFSFLTTRMQAVDLSFVRRGWVISPAASIMPVPSGGAAQVTTFTAMPRPHVALSVDGQGTQTPLFRLTRVTPGGQPDTSPGQPAVHVRINGVIASHPGAGAPPAAITIPAGQTSVTLGARALANVPAAEGGTVTLEIQSDDAPAGYDCVIHGLARATASIVPGPGARCQVSLSGAAPVEEGAGVPLVFHAQRTPPLDLPLTVNLGIVPPPNPAPDDLLDVATEIVSVPATATFAAGESRVAIPVFIRDDAASEPVERLVLELREPAQPGAYSRGAGVQAEGRVFNDDLQDITVEVLNASVTEPSSPSVVAPPAVVVFRRTGDVSEPLSLTYSLSGEAQPGVDFAGLPGVIAFLPGQAEASISIFPVADGVKETRTGQAESVRLVPGQRNTRCRFAAGAAATILIFDAAGDVPAVSLEPAEHGKEGGQARMIVRTSAPSPVPIAVPLVLDQASVLAEGQQQAGSAADISLPAAVVIPAGETSVVVNCPLAPDAPDDLEVLRVKPGDSPAFHPWPGMTSADLWALEPAAPTVFLDAHRQNLTEPAGLGAGLNKELFVSRFNLPAAGAASGSVAFSPADSTAQAGDLESPLTPAFTLATAGDFQLLRCTAQGDTSPEGEEFAVFRLQAPANGSYSRGNLRAAAKIEDNDGAPSAAHTRHVAFANAGQTVVEPVAGDRLVEAGLTLTGAALPNGLRVVVFIAPGSQGDGSEGDDPTVINPYLPVATGNGIDYTLLTPRLEWTTGNPPPLVQLLVHPDDAGEGPEPIHLKIASAGVLQPAGYFPLQASDVPHTVSLSDDDPVSPGDYERWRVTQFSAGELADEAVSGPFADPDADGLDNRLEYVFGQSARAGASPMPGVALTIQPDGRRTLHWPAVGAELPVLVETSTTLADWHAVTDIESAVRQGGEVRVTLPPPAPGAVLPGREYFRLRIASAP